MAKLLTLAPSGLPPSHPHPEKSSPASQNHLRGPENPAPVLVALGTVMTSMTCTFPAAPDCTALETNPISPSHFHQVASGAYPQ